MSGYHSGRRSYRIKYPVADRPVFRDFDDWAEYRVVDCSELGLRFAVAKGAEPPGVGWPMRGIIRLLCGTEAPVAGMVARIERSEVVVHFSSHTLPRDVMFQEHLYLRNKYPNWL